MDYDSSQQGSRLFIRRQSRTHLDPLHIPPLDTSEPVRYVSQNLYHRKWHHIQKSVQDVEDEGQELFQNFLFHQIEREPSLIIEDVAIKGLSGYSNDLRAENGLALQLKAEAFRGTKQREDLRGSSANVDLSMTQEQFKAHLNRFYFQDRARLNGILGLFFLCSDITIRALKESLELFEKYLTWSLDFIKSSVSLWVHQQGGWSAVLKTSVHPVLKVCLWIAMSAIALFTLVRLNKLKSSKV